MCSLHAYSRLYQYSLLIKLINRHVTIYEHACDGIWLSIKNFFILDLQETHVYLTLASYWYQPMYVLQEQGEGDSIKVKMNKMKGNSLRDLLSFKKKKSSVLIFHSFFHNFHIFWSLHVVKKLKLSQSIDLYIIKM